MFTIEHEFDATVVTLIDDLVAGANSGAATALQEDVTINAFASVVTLEQYDSRTDRMQKITFSVAQLHELQAALDLPEGSYRFESPKNS